jgi:putative transposase
LELLKGRATLVSRETIRRALHRLGFRWRRPRPVPPEKDSEEQREQKRARLEDVLQMVEGAGPFFQDETRLETNPKVGFCWMRKGKQKPLPTPGTNRKAWISGALNFHTGRLHWVVGKRKDGGLFIDLLDELRRTYRCHKQLRLAVDNDSSHTSKRVEKYVEGSGGRIRLHPLLPWWSPESNPMESVWWSSHEAVSRNHECAELDDLVEFAEGYLKERQPFMLKLGEVYEQLERSPP